MSLIPSYLIFCWWGGAKRPFARSNDCVPITRRHHYLLRSALDEFPDTRPMILFRIGALVVWRMQVVPIVNRWVYPDAVLYLIHTRSSRGELVTDASVTFGQLVGEINNYAHFCVGDKLSLGPHEAVIRARWWSCRQGTVMYRVGHPTDERRSARFTQENLLLKVEAEMERSV